MNCPKCERGGTGPHPAWCTPQERFWRKVTNVYGSGCWEWTGASHPFGYGTFRLGNGTKAGVLHTSHRYSWEQHYGPIPSGLHVCHHCDNPRCVRPSHLFLGSQADNMQDMIGKGRNASTVAAARARRKTHCQKGHPFSDLNTYVDRDGNRSCRACRRKPGGRGPTLLYREAAL